MPNTANFARILIGTAWLAAAAAAQGAQALPAAASQPSQWQHHQGTLLYDGLTARYTCDGLEDKVRELLLYLGARKNDLKVDAFGCAGGPNHPSRIATVKTDFYSLAAADAGAAEAVPGQWVALSIAPRRPSFMGEGECELVDQIKNLLTNSFSLRNVEYRTTCIPQQVTIADYNVKGEILKPVVKKTS